MSEIMMTGKARLKTDVVVQKTLSKKSIKKKEKLTLIRRLVLFLLRCMGFLSNDSYSE